MLPTPTAPSKPRPARIPLDQMAIDCIPAELKERTQWVLWSWSWKEKSGKWDKPPRQPNRKMAKSNDPSTWVTFAEALAAYQTGRFDGIGHVITAPFVGIDVDGCIDPDGFVSPWAQEILDAFSTYGELSPSQTGFKLWARGTLPEGCSTSINMDVPAVGDKTPAIEVYDGGLYFTVTGHPIGELRPIADCQPQLDALLAKYGFVGKPKTAPPKVESNGHTKMFTGASTGGPADAAEIAEALRFIPNSGEGQHYNDWLSIGMCLHDWSTTEGYNLWLDWSKQSNKHDDDTCRAKWASFTAGGGLTIRTVFKRAMEGGWANPRKRETTEAKTAPKTPPGAPPAGDDAAPKTGVQIILEYFRGRYQPLYRHGSAISCVDGADVPMNVACALPSSDLIDQLAAAIDAPQFPGGAIKRAGLPAFFKNWARVAWGDLLKELPDEDTADLTAQSPAGEVFRQLVRDALLAQITLGDLIGSNGASQTERRSLIDWCWKFAKPGCWKSIRSFKCWCQCRQDVCGALVLRVAIRHELFAQLGADKRLRDLTANTFTRRAQRYGVGTSTRDDRPGGQSVVVLDPDFVMMLSAGIRGQDDDA